MSEKHGFTASQRRVFDFLWQFFDENDQLPPKQVVADTFGWASPNAAQEYMNRLEGHGLIVRNAVGKYRFTALGRAKRPVYSIVTREAA